VNLYDSDQAGKWTTTYRSTNISEWLYALSPMQSHGALQVFARPDDNTVSRPDDLGRKKPKPAIGWLLSPILDQASVAMEAIA
jgi:hypothetical protein